MAARKTPLHAVSLNEKPKPQKKKVGTVTEAVADGTRRDELVAMRTRIAKAIDDPNIRGADLAALSRRLLEIGKEIEAADAVVEQEAAESVEVDDEAFDAEAL